jgi:hypothetical protein
VNIGEIIHIKNFQLPNKVKNKFFVVLYEDNDDAIVVSMTTSKVYISDEQRIPGTIKTTTQHLYFIPKNKVVGTNGFSFRKDTFLLTFNNTYETQKEELKLTYPDIEVMCKLTDKEFLELAYCFYKSPYVSRKHKRKLEPIIEQLTK